MDNDRDQLRERLESFSIDERGATFSFTHRLARDNAWSLAYARRVVREYKRFVLLAVSTGHPATPSDEVDQAWHLHLTYTEAYARFCAEVLRAPLHHRPTQGGPREAAKFHSWYERTLQCYREHFCEEPPSDIWPSTKRRFADAPHYARVHTRDNWIIPKPQRVAAAFSRVVSALASSTGQARTLALAPSAFATASCSWIGGVPPFDWTGLPFISLFAFVWLVGHLVASDVSRRCTEAVSNDADLNLGPYEMAYLAGGEKMVTSAAISSLVQRGALSYDATSERLTCGRSRATESDPVERALWTTVAAAGDDGCEVDDLRLRSRAAWQDIDTRLRSLGLLGGPIVLRSLLIALAAPMLGAIKVGVGISRDKPVGFLTVLCIIAVHVAWTRFGVRRHRSASGDVALAELRQEHASLRDWNRDPQRGQPQAVAAAVALFGVDVLAGTDLTPLRSVLYPSGHSDRGGGGDGSGGDGGGGDGGGCGGCGGG